MSNNTGRINMPLDEELTRKIERIKKYYGIGTNTDIVRFLVKKEHREIKEKEGKLID